MGSAVLTLGRSLHTEGFSLFPSCFLKFVTVAIFDTWWLYLFINLSRSCSTETVQINWLTATFSESSSLSRLPFPCSATQNVFEMTSKSSRNFLFLVKSLTYKFSQDSMRSRGSLQTLVWPSIINLVERVVVRFCVRAHANGSLTCLILFLRGTRARLMRAQCPQVEALLWWLGDIASSEHCSMQHSDLNLEMVPVVSLPFLIASQWQWM